MNEQPSKKILFNKSTLLSLKAELLKKQEEVNEKKQLPQNKVENFKPPSGKAKHGEKAENKERKKSFKDGLKAVDTEELEACRKAKLALEKKAELYEHLADSSGDSELAARFLVDFRTKKDEELKESAKQDPETAEPEDSVISVDESDADDWTEFTDCLGRTRKCHKSDLNMFIMRDQRLMKIMYEDKDGTKADGETSETQNPTKEKPLLVQKTNDYLQSLRQKWEEKERDMLAKDKDIHYQDLLFDEARIHGVGYYSFSTDETERQKQMAEMMKQREATLQAQKQAEETRKKRDEIMAARVKAARARQRLRAGLPPEDPEETQKDFTAHLLEFLTQQKNEADAKAKEEEKKRKEEEEKERQKLREAYVREWDLGKDGVDDKVKKFREMTQEEYVEQQRGKRIDEFAPPQMSPSIKSNYTFDDQGRMINPEEKQPKSWSDVRPRAKTPPPPVIGDMTEEKGLYFSSKKQVYDSNKAFDANTSSTITEVRLKTPSPPNITRRDFKYRNFVKTQEPTPIVNELTNDELSDDIERREKEGGKEKIDTNKGCFSGVEVAPPPTYEYYGPIPKKTKFKKPFESDIREAYAQGTKSLEAKTSSRQIAKDYDFSLE